MPSPRLLIHGGASVAFWRTATPVLRAQALVGLATARDAGAAVLRSGGSAIDAVCAAVMVLEDDPLFNAGTGAVRTSSGTLELDAALMCGETARCAAICGIRQLLNPIDGCRRMLAADKPVFMWGPHAEHHCLGLGAALRHDDGPRPVESHAAGTVGALALDAAGQLAAATSTGGLAGKLPGRIGDSPVIGAGTWADRGCAVSCTGDGELFIRLAVARSLALAADPLAAAATQPLARVAALGGMGGLIALRADGCWTAAVTGGDIARAWWTADGVSAAGLLAGDPWPT